MELYEAEATMLRKMVEEWLGSPERELEATFGEGGKVSATAFLNVVTRLRAKGFTALPQEDRLTITLPENIRFTLLGTGVIQQYCRDNTLAGKPFIAMIKDRTGQESNLDIDNYDVRVKVRREVIMAANDGRVQEVFSKWPTQKKAFRMIRRWSFAGQGIQFDMSIVRSTPVDLKGNYKWQRKFLDYDILGAAPVYEIEVELKRGEEKTLTAQNATLALVAGMGEVLRGLQNNSLLIRKKTKTEVLDLYKSWVGDLKFRGPSPYTLTLENMTEERTEGVPNIRDNYNVTDKADGLRVLAITDSKGDLFMMDAAFQVYRTGLRKPELASSMLDGEWVTKDKKGKAIQQLLIFDIFYDKNKRDVSKLPFYSSDGTVETRHRLLNLWVQTWNSGDGPVVRAAGLAAANRLSVSAKVFHNEPFLDIFQRAAVVLDTSSVYYTDGLIFTPNTAPLPSQLETGFPAQLKWKPAEDNSVDFLVMTQKVPETKADLVTTGFKPLTGEATRYKTLHLFVGTSKDPAFENPRGTILYEKELPAEEGGKKKFGVKPVLFNPTDYPDPSASTCYREIQTDPDTNEEYIVCEKSNEPIQDKAIVEMRYDPSQPEGWRWIPIRVRHDKIERLQKGIFARTMNRVAPANNVWRSIHEPVTVHMIRTGAEQPSAEEVQQMSEKTAGRLALTRRYYDRKAPSSDIEKVKGLRNFHNRWIKEQILLRTGLRGGDKKLVDMAVGKAADLQKWMRNRVAFVLGVDTSGPNILDPEDGAYRRYLNTMLFARQKGQDRSEVPPMVFVIGDSSKTYVNGEAGVNNEEGDILRAVYGSITPRAPLPPFVQKEAMNALLRGADCVACMFALHYFFENSAKLDGFLKNVRDSLKLGGYFIGCCFDGQKVFDLLADVQKGTAKTGTDDNTVLWTITKEYDEEELPKDESALGMAIDVDFISIGTTHREYLVPFDLLVEKMRSIGCELLNKEELRTLDLQDSTNLFEKSYEMAAKARQNYPMSSAVKQFSFLNRWFIFKRKAEAGLGAVVVEEEAATAGAASGPSAGPPPAGAAAGAAAGPSVGPPPAGAAAGPSVGPPPAGAASAVAPVPSRRRTAAAATPTPTPAIGAAGVPVRTVPVEAGTALPQPFGRRYAVKDIFKFFSGAPLKDNLKIGKPSAARWLTTSAPFPLIDPEEADVVYPTMEHYLAAMKIKRATDKPELAKSLFSRDGVVHQKYAIMRTTEAAGKPLPEERDYSLLKAEIDEVKQMLKPSKLKNYRATYREADWIAVKDDVLKAAVKLRWERDALYRQIINKVKEQEKILLNYSLTDMDLGGKLDASGTLEGSNKLGLYIMQIAEFPEYS